MFILNIPGNPYYLINTLKEIEIVKWIGMVSEKYAFYFSTVEKSDDRLSDTKFLETLPLCDMF